MIAGLNILHISGKGFLMGSEAGELLFTDEKEKTCFAFEVEKVNFIREQITKKAPGRVVTIAPRESDLWLNIL